MSGESFAVQGPEEVEPTEAELTGEEGEGTPFLSTPVTPGVTPTAPPEVPPEPGKEAAAVPGKDSAAPTEPPAPKKDDRVVPYAALHEERIARQRLAAQIEELRKQIPTEPRKTPAELILEDPENAMTVLTKEIDDLRAEIARGKIEQEINTAVPDFFEKAAAMEELLLGEQFSEESIRDLIVASGKDAPKFFKILSKLVDQPSEEALRTKLVAELTPKITADVTRDLMAKFKIVDQGIDITKLPGTPPDGKLKVNGEEEFARLTLEQQEKWLAGEL